ncbi:unnamed protein product [Alopecurus aequalis]
MDKTSASGLAQDNGRTPTDSTSAPSKGKRGRKGSQIIASKSYPLRSAHSSARVLRSTSKNKSKTPNEPVNSLTPTHSSAKVLCSTPEKKGKSPKKAVNPLRSTHSSASRSTLKKNDKAPNEPVNDNTAVQPAAKKRKRGRPSSAAKSKNENEPVNDNTAVQPAAKKRKRGRPSSAAKSKNENEPVNDNTAVQPAAKKRKRGRPSSAAKSKNENEPVNDNTAVQPAAKKRKRGRPSSAVKSKNENECTKIRQRVRYILNRMNYEQSLIQAYASDGWKGQSLEKIRPEKELERAKAEILRCKLRIREAIRNMDSLLSEGKLDESLFDSEGEISSEDIFCAICASKHVTLKNDIILCDGVCDRGFHQKCLNPPLLAEDIPEGDEGWLCPACDCKLDCIDLLNELQGSTLSIHDSWEKVFPESALPADSSKQIGGSDLPSDDSEDDYDPTITEGNMVDDKNSSADDGDEGSDSDDLDFMTTSDDSEPSMKKRSESKNKNTVDDLGLPSDDSEDENFDPEGPDSSDDQKTKTNSDESDFTSDSDDFCAEILKSCGQNEASAPSFSDQTDRVEIMEAELEQDLVLPVSCRRQVGRLDYKKLYDDAYGKETSDPSDEEEWSGNSTHPNGNLDDSDTDSLDGSLKPAKSCSKRARGGHQNNDHTPKSEQYCGSVSEQRTEVLHSNGSSSTARKRYGPIVNQKLKAHFEKDPYPSRPTKESLAQELGLTLNQVTKWFASTRHYSRVVAAKKGKRPENNTAETIDRMAADSIPQIESNGRVLEKPILDGNDNVPEERMAQDNLDVNPNRTTDSRKVGSPNGVPGGNQYSSNSRNAEDAPFRQDVGLDQAMPVTPTTVNQNGTTDSSNVGSPGMPRGNQRRGASKNVGSPRGGSSEKSIPGLEVVDEARKKAILRELRKMKKGR